MPTKPPVKKVRKLKMPKYQTFKLQKRMKVAKPKLPSVWQLSKQTMLTVRDNKRFFITYILLYGLLSFIFIQSSTGLNSIQQARELVGNQLGGTLSTSVILYAGLVGSSAQFSNQIIAIYQFSLVLIFSLAVIYGLRRMYSKSTKKVTIKESLYKGMTPLVPVLLILILLALELLPLSIGTSLYATVIANGLAVGFWEMLLWAAILILLVSLTVFLVSSTLFGLFVVTLPNMTPVKALKAARDLVRYRRLPVIRKLVFLPLVLLLIVGLVVVPFIAWLPAAAQAVFYVTSSVVLPLALAYMYNLYRSLL